MKKLFTHTLTLQLLFLMCLGAVSVHAQKVVTEWARQIGGNDYDNALSVTTDPWGNVYYTGFFSSTVDFNPGAGQMSLTASGKQDIFISKFSPDGQFIWAKQIGDASHNQANAGMCVKADSFGHIYVSGIFTGDPDFNPGSGTHVLSASGSSDGFLLKMDSAGNYQWAVNVGPVLAPILGNRISDRRTYGVSLKDSFLYITGSADKNVYLSKLDTSGAFIWTQAVGGNLANYSYALAVDDAGDVYATGMFSSDSIDFDPGPGRHVLYNSSIGASQNSYDIFIWKLDKLGNFVWAKVIGSPGLMDQAKGIAVDQSGDVYLNGSFVGAVDFNPGGTPAILNSNFSNNSYAPFIAKYTSGGNLIWVHPIGSIIPGRTPLLIPNWTYDLALDSKGNAYSIGRFTGTLDFDPGAAPADTFILQSRGNNNIFISKLDPDGKLKWAKRFVEAGYGEGHGIYVDDLNNVYATGVFSGAISFDSAQNYNFTSMGAPNDMFLVKFNQFCDDSFDSTRSVAICEDEYLFNGRRLTQSGIYRDTLFNEGGCYSIITLDLNLRGKLAPPVINVKKFELGTVLRYYTYQWMLNGSVIPGATDSVYTVQQNGTYQVIVTNKNGCRDTSDIYEVTNYTGIEGARNRAHQINIYPNPAKDMVYIDAPVPVQATITTMDGRLLKQATNETGISVKGFATGMYLIQIRDEEGRLIKVEKLVCD